MKLIMMIIKNFIESKIQYKIKYNQKKWGLIGVKISILIIYINNLYYLNKINNYILYDNNKNYLNGKVLNIKIILEKKIKIIIFIS